MNLSSRVNTLNKANENTKGRYVLYWMQMFKRASHNYALNFAIQMANERRLPLVVYEGLQFYYPGPAIGFTRSFLKEWLRSRPSFPNVAFATSFICNETNAMRSTPSRGSPGKPCCWLQTTIRVS